MARWLAGLVAPAILAAGPTVQLHSQAAAAPRDASLRVPILVYHRFGPVVRDSMTVRTTTFRWQLEYLKTHQHPIVSLRSLVAYLQGTGAPPPRGSVVITADDGHASVISEMLPAVRADRVPVTLFIYPSAISNASYAMTWQQLAALRDTGLFDIQSHTYWHPNFKIERRRLSPEAYRTFAMMQLVKPRAIIEKKLGHVPDLLAWPFGIYDDGLIAMAREAGYAGGFTLDRRPAGSQERLMAMPRFLMTDAATGHAFSAMVDQKAR